MTTPMTADELLDSLRERIADAALAGERVILETELAKLVSVSSNDLVAAARSATGRRVGKRAALGEIEGWAWGLYELLAGGAG